MASRWNEKEQGYKRRKANQKTNTTTAASNANKNRKSTDTRANSGKPAVQSNQNQNRKSTDTRANSGKPAKPKQVVYYRSKDDAKPVYKNPQKTRTPAPAFYSKDNARPVRQAQVVQQRKSGITPGILTGESFRNAPARFSREDRSPIYSSRRQKELDNERRLQTRVAHGGKYYRKRNDVAAAARNEDIQAAINTAQMDDRRRTPHSFSIDKNGKWFLDGRPLTQESLDRVLPFGLGEDYQDVRKLLEDQGFKVKTYLYQSEADKKAEKEQNDWIFRNWDKNAAYESEDVGDTDLFRLARNRDIFNAAKEAGDKDEMARAHAENERIRAKYGYSGGAAGDQVIRGDVDPRKASGLNQAGYAALSMAALRKQNAVTEEEIAAAEQEEQRILNEPKYQSKISPLFDQEAMKEQNKHQIRDLTKGAALQGIGNTGVMMREDLNMMKYAGAGNEYDTAAALWARVSALYDQLDAETDEKKRGKILEQIDWASERANALSNAGDRLAADPSSPWFDEISSRHAKNPKSTDTFLNSGVASVPQKTMWDEMAERGDQLIASAEDRMSPGEKFAADLYANAIQMVPTTVAGLIPGAGEAAAASKAAKAFNAVRKAAQVGALWQMAESAGGGRYRDLVARGIPYEQARTDAQIAKAIEMGTESVPLHYLSSLSSGTNRLGKTALGALGASAAIEGTEEGIAYSANALWSWMRGYEEDKFSWAEMGRDMLAGGIMGGLHAGLGLAVNRAVTSLRSQGREQDAERVQAYMDDITGIMEQSRQYSEMVRQGALSEEEGAAIQSQLQEDLVGRMQRIRDHVRTIDSYQSMADQGILSQDTADYIRNTYGQELTGQETISREEMQDAVTQRLYQAAMAANSIDTETTAQREARERTERAQRMYRRGQAAMGEYQAGRESQIARDIREAQQEETRIEASPAEQAQQAGQAALEQARTALARAEAARTAIPEQEARQMVSSMPNERLEGLSRTMGEKGSQALMSIAGAENNSNLVRDFVRVYNQALSGNIGIEAPRSMTQAEFNRATEAGIADRMAGITMDMNLSKNAAGRNKNAGINRADPYVRGMDKQTVKTLDAFAKTIGAKIEFTEFAGSNGSFVRSGNVITIAKNNPLFEEDPVLYVMGHESTHRMQDLDAESYNAFRDYVMSLPGSNARLEKTLATYREANAFKPGENQRYAAMDEMTADFAGTLLRDQEELRQFIRDMQQPKVLRALLNAFRAVRDALTGRQKAQADEAVRLLEEAIKASSQRVKEIENGNRQQGRQRAETAGRGEPVRDTADEVAERQLREQAERLRDARAEMDRRMSVSDEAREFSDVDVRYSIRTEDPPKKTGIAYKVFFAKNGQLYPPMVANPGGEGTPVGVWLNADVGQQAPPSKTGRQQVKAGGKGTQGGSGSLAFRPGWHLGDVPQATQFARMNPETGKKELAPANFVWAECEYAADVDYQEEAMSYGYTENGKFRHSYAGLPRLPENGFYRYRTNPKPDTVPWIITGAMKVTRILTDAETDAICRENGVEPMKRQGGPMTAERMEKELGIKAGDTAETARQRFSLAGRAAQTAEMQMFRQAQKMWANEVDEERRKKPPKLGGDDVVFAGSRFSLSAPVEETDRFIALHNLRADQMKGALELGGFAMPSVAMTRAEKGHTSYGDISVVFGKDSVSPTDRRNVIFSGDAYTPTFPAWGYKISESVANNLSKRIDALLDGMPRELRSMVSLDTTNIRDNIQRFGEDFAYNYRGNLAMKTAYLIDQGETISARMKTAPTNSGMDAATIRKAIRMFGDMEKLNRAPASELNRFIEPVKDLEREFYRQKYQMKPELADSIVAKNGYADVRRLLDDAMYLKRNGSLRKTLDKEALERTVNRKLNTAKKKAAFDEWLRRESEGIIEKKGVRNDKDTFTRKGNRRSFEQLHYDFTLANIVKAMQKERMQGKTSFLTGSGNIRGAAAKTYGSIEEARKEIGRIRSDDEIEEIEAEYKAFDDKCKELCERMIAGRGKGQFVRTIEAAEVLTETLATHKTEESIYRYMMREWGPTNDYNITPEIAHDAAELIKEAQKLPERYMEAKLYRAVDLSEPLAYIVPRDMDKALMQQMKDAGLTVKTYKAGDNEDRLKKVNSVKGARFSISPQTDADYLAAVERGDVDTAQRMVDEAAKAAGYTIKAYHGTPNGTFHVFRDWSYFTEDRDYADVYQNQGASSNGYKQTADNPKTYGVYLKSGDVFDTRTAKDRAIFQKEFYRQWGNGAPLSERGLPDWTDGDDLIEFFDEKGYVYDAFYLDEGGTGGFGDEVHDRGVSIVIKDPAQVKSADPVTYDDAGNVIPLSERFNEEKEDIRYSITPESINPNEIMPVNGIHDRGMFEYLVSDFRENGWNGRPIVVVDEGNQYQAITGSHRIFAAREAGIDVSAIVLDYDEDIARLIEANSDDDRERVAKELADEGVLDHDIADLIVRENDLNFDNWGVPYEQRKRYSLGGTEQMDAVALMRENQLLRDQLEQWKSQVKPSDRTKVRPETVKKLARRLAKDYSTEMDTEEIAKTLQSIYDGMGRDLSYERAYEEAGKLARAMIEEASETEDSLYHQYRDLREHFRETALIISPDMKADISADYGDWRKRHFGRMKLKAGDRTNVDQVFQEAAEKWPEMFSEEVSSTPADQVLRIAEVLDSVYAVQELNTYAGDMDAPAGYLAAEIMESFWDMPQIQKTFADKAEDRLLRQKMETDAAKANGQDQVQRLRAQKNQRIDQVRAEEREKREEAVRREKEKGSHRVREEQANTRWREAEADLLLDWREAQVRHETSAKERAKARRRREKSLATLRAKHKKQYDKAMTKLREDRDARLQAQKEKYLGQKRANSRKQKERELRAKIERHVKKLSTKLRKPTDTQHIPEDLRLPVATALDSINLSSKNGKPTKRTQAFSELQAAYRDVLENGGEVVVDPALIWQIDKIIGFRDTPIANLGLDDLNTVWDVVKAIEASISTYNKMLGRAKFETVSEPAFGIRDYLTGRKNRGDFRGPFRQMDRLLNFGMMTPEGYFLRLGESGKGVFKMIRDAQDQNITILKDAEAATREIIKPGKHRKLEKEKHTFTFDDQTVELTTAQIMNLYVLMGRQQAADHIMVGGFRPDAVKKGIKDMAPPDAWHLTQDQVSEILDSLTPEETKIADGLRQYIGTELTRRGNEASMEVYGYKKFREKSYWPIETDKNQVQSDVKNDAVSGTVAGWGSAKPLTPHANNAVIVRSIFDVYADHVTGMAKYASWLATMENLNRIFNFRYKDEEGHMAGGVKTELERAFGKNGSSYWKNLMDDLNAGVKARSDNPFQALTGAYKASAIAGNIRVIVQQPTAILRALDMLNPADIAAGMALARPGKWDKTVKEYAPIAVWKDWGYFTADTGKQMRNVLFGDDNAVQRFNYFFMNNPVLSPGAADSVTWTAIWNAVEIETRRKRKDLTPKSEEYYQAVADRFNDVIDHTQVVDGIPQRSQIMRSTSDVTKMATSFMSEPTKSYNMMTSAIYEARNAKGAARGKAMAKLGRSTLALMASFAVNAAVQSIVDAVRDDDKDEEYWEKFLQAYFGEGGETRKDQVKSFFMEGNLGAAFNPATYIPFVKDILSIGQGYTVSRMDMDVISKVMKEVQNVQKAMNGEGKKTVRLAWINLAAEVSRFLGMPVANLKRDILAFSRTFYTQTGNYRMQYELEKFMYDETNPQNMGEFAKLILLAERAGDNEAAEYIRSSMISAGADGEKLDKKLASLRKTAVEDSEEFQTALAQRTDAYSTMLDASPQYQELTGEQQTKARGMVEDYAKWQAYGDQVELNENDQKSFEKMQAAEAEQIDPALYAVCVTAFAGMKNDKDENGEDIKGQHQQDKVIRYIRALPDLTNAQRSALYHLKYDSDKNNPWA